MRNDDKVVEEMMCLNVEDYLKGYYFLDFEASKLTPLTKDYLMFLTKDYETEIVQYVEQENIKLRKEWDFIDVLLYFKYVKYDQN